MERINMKTREKITIGLWIAALLCALLAIPTTAQRGGSTQAAAANWAISSAPATSSQATVSKAAVPGWRHVAGNVCFSGTTGGTAPAVTSFNVNLRDGATGAGTVLASWTVLIPATINVQAPAPFCTGPLNIGGSVNTAMTIEFSASLTNLNENVSMVGFDIPQ